MVYFNYKTLANESPNNYSYNIYSSSYNYDIFFNKTDIPRVCKLLFILNCLVDKCTFYDIDGNSLATELWKHTNRVGYITPLEVLTYVLKQET